jgi:hypothetical protein
MLFQTVLAGSLSILHFDILASKKVKNVTSIILISRQNAKKFIFSQKYFAVQFFKVSFWLSIRNIFS